MRKRDDFEKNSLIDVHTHGMGIMLTHMLSGHYPYSQDIIDLSKKVRNGGADYVVTFSMPTSIYYDVAELKKRRYRRAGNCDFPFQYENRAIVQSVKDFSLDNVLPFLSFSTRTKIEEQKTALIDLINSYDVYGLKYHATIERRSVLSKGFSEFAEVAKKYNIPILVHTKIDQWANPNYLIDFSVNNPDVRVCAAHCAHFDEEFYRRLKCENNGNLFVDCSPFTRICHDIYRGNKQNVMNFDYGNPKVAFEQLINEIPSCLLWGTDTPFNVFCGETGVSDYCDEVAVVSDDGIKRKLFENTMRFLFGN